MHFHVMDIILRGISSFGHVLHRLVGDTMLLPR